MKDISLKELLEAGCHFGHRVERWHPKAASFIYQPREGIHIIDLVKTRDGLKKASEYIKDLALNNKSLLFVGTKRQAKGVVSEAAKRGGIFYLTNRWIGGFFTNWEEVKKNIEKIKKLRQESLDGTWKKFPKHEQVKLGKHLKKLEVVYAGVVNLTNVPDAVFIVDIKKEESCFKEAIRRNVKTVAIVDTNTDSSKIDYPIPANDDAVGSIQIIVNHLVESFLEGKKVVEKKEGKLAKRQEKAILAEQKEEKVKEVKVEEKSKEEKKRGRPKKK